MTNQTDVTRALDDLLVYVACSPRPSRMAVVREVRALRELIAGSDLPDQAKQETDSLLAKLTQTIFAIEGAGPGPDVWRLIKLVRGEP